MARILLQPTVRAAQTLIELGTVKDTEGAEFSLNALVAALDMQVRLTNKGDLSRAEALLVAQAHTLDAIYHKLVNRAVMNVGTHLDAAEAYMKLALRAQSHCRATLQALAVMKNPSPVAFVGQANIANGPQQVNNAPAVAAKGSRAGQSQTNFWRNNPMNGWTEQRRSHQSQLIRNWMPWERSTGPRTAGGKARVARNAYKGGVRLLLRQLAKTLRAHAP